MPGVGQLQWTVLPMGLRNSPQTQQRAMEQLIAGLDPEHVLCLTRVHDARMPPQIRGLGVSFGAGNPAGGLYGTPRKWLGN